jgi:3-deoxy-manno-octulosonate cytidylyltransferase (CMP-KDO synthetase)
LTVESVVAVIPARYASQRLPAKPLVDLLGKPMIQRVYEQVRQASLPSRVVVATDDERIADVVRSFGGEVMLTPASIKSGSDRVAAVAREIPGDIYVNVQGDEPLIPPAMIDDAVRVLLADPGAQVGTLARRIDAADDLVNPAVVKVVVTPGGVALYFSRAAIPFLRDVADRSDWVRKHPFFKHVGMYVFRRDFLLTYASMPESVLERAERLEQLRILESGFTIKVGITQYDSLSIDTPDDVQRVIGLLRAKH